MNANTRKTACLHIGLVLFGVTFVGCSEAPPNGTHQNSSSGGIGGLGNSSSTDSSGSTSGAGGMGGTGGVAGNAGSGGAAGSGGSGGFGGATCTPLDDGNPCTDDLCENGLPVHYATPTGSACSIGGILCDGMGSCVDCLIASDCPGIDDQCQTRTCVQGQCLMEFAAVGTILPIQNVGDCRVDVCDGNGNVIAVSDDADLPDDLNPCTTNLCMAGSPSNPFEAAGTSCGVSQVCNPMGSCVGCNVASDCQGVDDECKMRTCLEGTCGIEFTMPNTPIAAQVPGDCVRAVCNGNGQVIQIADDADLPLDDGNACTDEVCSAGMIGHPAKMDGFPCSDGNACTQTDDCQSGVCTGQNTVVCPLPDQCHVQGSCDPATGVCSNPALSDGTACSDGDECSQLDVCFSGICNGLNPVVCSTPDSCHLPGTCDPGTGTCSNPASADGTNCNDTDSCTLVDTCQAGACIGSNPVICSAGLICMGGACLAPQCTGTLGLPGVPQVNIAASTAQGELATADFNGDGKLDMAVLNLGGANSVTVTLNNGNVTFSGNTTYGTGTNPSSIEAADLNGDVAPDLVIANGANNTVSVLLNNGNGTFAPKVDYAVGTLPTHVSTADFNGDNTHDLAVTNRTSNTVSILLGNGNGTFMAKVDYQTGVNPQWVTSADMNADGSTDLAVTNFTSKTVSIFENQGAGVFGTKVDYSIGNSPRQVAAADVTGDGKPDLAIANGLGTVTIMHNTGNGTFLAGTNYGTGIDPRSVAVIDVNGDGSRDLAVPGDGTLSVLLNDTMGIFLPRVDYPAGANPGAMAIGDLNGDGHVDLALTSWGSGTGVAIVLSNGDGSFVARTRYPPSVALHSTVTADFNGDGKPDVAAYYFTSALVGVWLNNGDGTLSSPVSYSTCPVADRAMVAADLNGDGKPDIAVACSNSQYVQVLMNNGDGTFAPKVAYAADSNVTPVGGIAASDINSDGKIDLVTANRSSDKVGILLNNGMGTFAAPLNIAAGQVPTGIVAADFNGDSKPDLAVLNEFGGTMFIYINNGMNTFAPPVSYSAGALGRAIGVLDVNVDGRPDVAVLGTLGSVRLFRNNGTGTFITGALWNAATSGDMFGFAFPDLNNDGRPDVAVTDMQSKVVTIGLNNGNNTFTGQRSYPLTRPMAITSADFNADGRADLAIGDEPGLSMLFNRCLP